MTLQNIIAGLIIAAALLYVGSILWKKAGAFSKKGKCADDCGCSAKSKSV